MRIERQRQPEIGIERALVELVEQHGGDALQCRIVENHAGEDPLGDHFDARLRTDLRAESDAQADGLADALAQRLRHAGGRAARRQPARLQHDQLAALRPGLVEQGQWHARGLAGAGRRNEHGVRPVAQGGREIAEDGVDREGRVEGAHDRWDVTQPATARKRNPLASPRASC